VCGKYVAFHLNNYTESVSDVTFRVSVIKLQVCFTRKNCSQIRMSHVYPNSYCLSYTKQALHNKVLQTKMSERVKTDNMTIWKMRASLKSE
jgi:hypothetical protein